MTVPVKQPEEVVDSLPLMELGTHYVRVTQLTPHLRAALFHYIRQHLCLMGLVKVGYKFTKAPKKVFAGVSADRSFFHFHRNEFESLCEHLDAYGLRPTERNRNIQVIKRPLYTPAALKSEYIEKRDPRDSQSPQIDYVVAPGRQKVIMARPGRGKTFMYLRIAARLGWRTLLLIKPMYIEKWIKDIKEAFKVSKGAILVIKGKKDLIKLMDGVMEGVLEPDFIILSNMTWFYYLKDYETAPHLMKDLGYPVEPHRLMEALKVGFKNMDEVHQDFHIGYRSEIYSHLPKSLGLSGTLISDDDFINNRYKVVFPINDRPPDMDDISHVKVMALHYKLVSEKKVKYINHGMKSYSHVKFEQSIMKIPPIWQAYRNMIVDITNKQFIRKRHPGQKMIIYCSTVEMCTKLAEWFKRKFPDMAVQRYVSDDDYEEMLESELIISTLKSLGTAIDIPKLSMILMTDAIKSIQSNLQAMERLRPLDKWWPGENPTFMYLVADQVDKHLEYHDHKRKIFRGKVVRHEDVYMSYDV